MAEIYYVYEHIRLDTNQVFYVGKGKNKKWWTNGIVNKRSEESPGIEWYNGQVRNNG
jgi:hypothetical protein